jgi:CHAT domain-containing protein
VSDDAQELIAVLEQASAAKERGDIDRARAGYAQVIASGQADIAPAGLLNLGLLERQQGRLEEARNWLGQAVATGHPAAKPWGLIALAELDARAGRLETARRQYAEAATADDPETVKSAQTGLDGLRKARAYLEELLATARQRAGEFGRLGTADALRQAREAVVPALQAQQPLHEIPVYRTDLAALLLGLYRSSDDETFLHAAAACIREAELEAALLPAPAMPRYLTVLGGIQLTQWNALHAGYKDAEVKAIGLVDDAISSLTAAAKQIPAGADPATGCDSPLYMEVVALLASAAFTKRHWLKTTPELAPYVNLLRGVLRDGIRDAASRAQCAWQLGRILWDMYAETGRPTLLAEAAEQYQAAASEAPADDPKRTAYQLRSTGAAAWLARETQDRPAAEAAQRRLADLWSQQLQASPAAVLDSTREWAELQARQQNWAASADAYQKATAAVMILFRRRAAADQPTFLRRFRGLFVHAAFALAHAGRLREAVAVLERGRGVFFVTPSGDTGQDTGWDPENPTQSALAKLIPGTAVAFVLATWYGGAAIGLSPGRDPWLVDLPQLTDDEVTRRLARLTAGYMNTHLPPNTKLLVIGADGREDVRDWAPEIDDVARWSWGACMGPLLSSLGACDELTLIPTGALPVLPLHAAWTSPESPAAEPATTADRTYALDLLAISYAPNLRAFLAGKEQWTGFADGLVLAVDNPASAEAAPVTGAGLEAAKLSQLFDQVLVLRDKDATAEAVRRELPRASLVNFSCHGAADLTHPDASRLLLAGPDTLSVAEIGQLDLSSVRLCVLSACETAMIGVEHMDEVINLPTALAQAGAGTVIGSLWWVPGEGAALLVNRFYQNLREGNCSPAEALRQAQRWLRDSTRGQQKAELRDLGLPSDPGSPPEQPKRSAAAQRLLDRIQPSQHITEWAAFMVTV